MKKTLDVLINAPLYALYMFLSCLVVMFAEMLVVKLANWFIVTDYYSTSVIRAVVYSIGVNAILAAIAFREGFRNAKATPIATVISGPEAQDLSEGVTFQDLPDRSGKIRRTAATDYGKIAKAIGDIQAVGIKVSLANINKSKFGFAPDVENNRILFGLKGMLNVGDDVVDAIIKNRPYASPKDFLQRVKPGKQAMVSLIKGGAFDDMEDRKFVMAWYLWETCDKKKRITLQNMSGLMKYDLIPNVDESMILAKRVFEFNRYLKAACKGRNGNFMLDERALNFIMELGEERLLVVYGDNYELDAKEWDKKVYQKYMDVIRGYLTEHKDELLTNLNSAIFMEDWNKYAKGTVSAWEMEVLCFYYHEHELSGVDAGRYGFADFFSLPEDPEVDRTFVKSGKEVNIFKLHRICGTCIAKNKTKSTVTILTTTGVVNVKFRKEYFSLFDKQISERGADGVKHVVEKSWFNRGNMIVVTGIRSGDDFVSKKYASTGGHQLYKIDSILPNGELRLKDARYQGGIEEDA